MLKKIELIKAIVGETNIPPELVKQVINGLIKVLIDNIRKKDMIVIPGFLTITKINRRCNNVNTGVIGYATSIHCKLSRYFRKKAKYKPKSNF